MRKIKFSITLFTVIFYAALSLAQVSPKKGVTPPAGFAEFQQMIQSEYSNGYYANKFRERKQIREQISLGLLPESRLVTDTVFALTLMGQFTDLPGFYTQQEFQARLYDGPNPTGTVTEYYTEISYDQLYFTGDAQGWYSVLGNIQNYSPGSSSGGPKFVVELIQASDPTLNYANYIQYYDAQNRPHIGFLAVVHSGAGAEAGANNIWSHRWNFTVYSGQPITTNDVDPVSGFNVIIDGPYAIMPERSGGNNNSGSLIEIGVFAHEFGHIFGLPDLYDTDGSSEGIGEWCLMASGSWGGNGSSPETPVHMSAWCKKELGWVTPINITSYQGPLSVPNAEENSVVYRMWRDGTLTNQYFLIENRQRIGFDANIHDSGFLIYHVDDAQGGNQNEDHYLVDVEQADGLRNLNNNQGRGDAGDPFPGSTQNTRFDIGNNPNSQDYSLQNTFVSVRNIYKDDHMMVGDFEIGPRPGVYAFCDPISSDFGRNEIGTESDTHSIILSTYGVDDLIISNIPNSVGDFHLLTSLTFPVTLSTYDSLTLEFQYRPTLEGQQDEEYTITNNSSNFTSINFTGFGWKIYAANNNQMYAISGLQNSGNFVSIDKVTGQGTNIGLSLFTDIKSIAIKPDTNLVYAMRSNTSESEILKVNAQGGDSYSLLTLLIPNLYTIAFDKDGLLYGISTIKTIYRIDLDAALTDSVSTIAVMPVSVAFDPTTNELWGTYKKTGTPKDLTIKIDLATGDTTIIGSTGFGVNTMGIAFDEAGVLYGTKGIAGTISELFTIDKSSGIGTLVGSIGLKDIRGLAYSYDEVVNSIDNEENIPLNFSLEQNYPNPFNPSTQIKFSLPVNANVRITIYNLLGQIVRELVSTDMNTGSHSVMWNSDDASGKKVSSGIYFYELNANGIDGKQFNQVRKMMLLK